MDPKTVFQAEPQSVERVMMEPNRGLYVPAYQRPYAWTRDHVGQLLTNMCEGIESLRSAETDDAITFIGTFIFVHDREYTTVEPQVRPQLPAAVFLVIDGQQRLTTLAILALALHDFIVRVHKKIEAPTEDVQKWLDENRIDFASRLEALLAIDKRYGDEHFKFYPRIIRAHDDQWSYAAASAQYRSPIAALISSYIEHTAGFTRPSDAEFKWEPGESEPHLHLNRNLKALVKTLRELFEAKKKNDDDDELPELNALVDDAKLQARFFKHEVPAGVCEVWEKDQTEAPLHERRVQQLSRAFLFARYFLDRVAVTQVLVTKEDYAFDLFEALNTTGEPLTAYETFKPTVIRQETLAGFAASPSAKSLAAVEGFLDDYAEKRQLASDRLLIPFALFEDGSKLGKHLRDQRNWLRRAYDAPPADPGSKRTFLAGMSYVARFLKDCWPERTREDGWPQTELRQVLPTALADEALLCLRVLRDSKHDVTIALLARFYAEILEKPEPKRAEEFCHALRAVTAFFALWRGSRVGTENIDAVYRTLMAREEFGVGPFKRRGGVRPTADQLRLSLRERLKVKNIDSSSGWVDRAVDLNVYQQSRELTRLLLLAASHDAVPDTGNVGFTVDGRTDVCPMLSLRHWSADLEIEHVAPQKRPDAASWADDIYSGDLIDTLGNLTLLPRGLNASAGNRSWGVKRLYFRAVSSEAADHAQLKAEAEAQGISFAEESQELLAEARYLPHLKALGQLPPDSQWSPEFIRNRSKHLAERAWRRLSPWLGL
ncbi:MAG: hypothetical protein AMXMBFR56_78730 [Polyangiaceae bacterium]